MGYTHYWDQKSNIPLAAWRQIVSDTNRLFKATKIPIAYEYDVEDPPFADMTAIRFNGKEEGGCETFLVYRNPSNRSDFCKTNQKDYDVVVCAALAVIAKHAPDQFEVRSDGGPENWTDALKWASSVLGYELAFPVKEKA